ncbi:hypothetical protein THIX_30404 [Thiomonas sp. X19]|uniref:hypothetical protein n=1 Tax=Thiomonas sp. X19 TaxID=1050370 RepID=UPI000B71B501|nr:hypothetical protein [Thiomonas sp. X19]SCC93176.1 hypothetical protein THIX_30404 [Thiomonas sp. X19]
MKTHHDLTKRQAANPEASTPEASTPQASTPEASTPQASTPQASTPQASTPHTMPSAIQSDVFVECQAPTRAEAEQAFGAVFELADPAEPKPHHG